MIKFNACCLLLILVLCSCSKTDIAISTNESETSIENEVLLTSTSVHSRMESELFDMVNDYRTNLNMNPLVFDSISLHFAKEHSVYMALNGVANHAKFEERARQIAKLAGAEFVAESVAKDYDNIELAFEAWLESNSHKKNIEGNYTNSAIGIIENEEGNLYFTQLFFR